MILTRIDMKQSDPRVRAALRDCQKMHRLVMGLFDSQRRESGVLYRQKIQGMTVSLYIYSDIPIRPEGLLPWMRLAGQRDVTDWITSMVEGRMLRFDLLTMPSKKTGVEHHKNSQRRVLRNLEDRLSWLERKAEQNGFAILSVQENGSVRIAGKHTEEQGGSMVWDAYHYNGILQITNPEQFQNCLSHGIGSGKAYGMGMLLLA